MVAWRQLYVQHIGDLFRQSSDTIERGLHPMAVTTGSQIRMARAALGWKVTTLAERAKIPWARLQHMERENNVLTDRAEVIEKVRGVLENAGVIFIDADESGGPGVRLSESTARD